MPISDIASEMVMMNVDDTTSAEAVATPLVVDEVSKKRKKKLSRLKKIQKE